jgi:hypothetical protein
MKKLIIKTFSLFNYSKKYNLLMIIIVFYMFNSKIMDEKLI